MDDSDSARGNRATSPGARPESRGNVGPAVMDLIRLHDGISRAELARGTSVSAQAMSKVVARLVTSGLVQEAGRRRAGVGKAPTRLSIVRDARFAVGVHLDRAGALVVLVNLAGEIVDKRAIQYAQVPPPDECLLLVGDVIEDLLAGRSGPGTVVGCGVGMAGPVNYRTGVATSPHNFGGWRDVPVAARLAARLGLPVALDKETNMAALGSHWLTARSGWTLVVYVGTGIGGALMLDGQVYRGVHSDAAEIGHMVLDPEGPPCVCGRHGCVEVYASPAAVVQRYAEATDGRRQETTTPVWSSATPTRLARIVQLAQDGDPQAVAAVQGAGETLGQTAGNLVAILDVDDVVLAGPLLDVLGPEYVNGVAVGLARVESGTRRATRIAVSSELHAEKIAVGAAVYFIRDVGL